MTCILNEHLLYGISNTILQYLKNLEKIVDQPYEHIMGHEILASEMQAA